MGSGSCYIRGTCVVPGCTRLQEKKGRYKGRVFYRRECGMHRQRKNKGLESNKCALCGWAGPCDVHRIVFGCNGGQYESGNTMAVCPNCHRLIHVGELRVEQVGVEGEAGAGHDRLPLFNSKGA